MGFNSVFKGLKARLKSIYYWYYMQGLQDMKLNCKCIRIIFELFHYINQSGGSMFL